MGRAYIFHICPINEADFSIAGLQDTTLVLDFRVTVLEENGGSDGNSSVAELELRVETLEGTTADHGTRISDLESDVTGNKIHFILIYLLLRSLHNCFIKDEINV